MRVTVLNTEQELLHFPLTQTIKLRFEEAVEDSLLSSNLYLFRVPNTAGLFNISETYNQSLGYIKEKFEEEKIQVYHESNTNGFDVTVKPLSPLSPGFEYVLFLTKNVKKEHLTVDKVISKSNSELKVTVSESTKELDLTVEIVSEPYLTSTSNIVKIQILNNLSGTSTTKIVDLKSSNSVTYDHLVITLPSTVYAMGEKFKVVATKTESLFTSDFFLRLKTSLTLDIKPIEQTNSSVSLSDIINHNKPKVEEEPLSWKVINNSKVRITLPSHISVSQLDFSSMSFTTSEAFGIYTLSQMGLYDDTKTYKVLYSIIDDRTVEVTINED